MPTLENGLAMPPLTKILCLLFLVASCKPGTVSNLANDGTSHRTVHADLWVPIEINGSRGTILKHIMGYERTVWGQVFVQATAENANREGGSFVQITPIFHKPHDKPTRSPVLTDDVGTTFRKIRLWSGVGIGVSLYIMFTEFSVNESEYQNTNTLNFLIEKSKKSHWRVATKSARTIGENQKIPSQNGSFDVSRSLFDKAQDIVLTKYTEPDAIGALSGAFDLLNDTARFIPGYAGAHDFLYGETQWRQSTGVILILADSVPLASSVKNASRIIRSGSQSFLAIGATTRIVDGIKTSIEGRAGFGTAVDITFGLVEGTLYAFSRVRVKLKLNGTNQTGDVAELISDLTKNGNLQNGNLQQKGTIAISDDQSAKVLSEFFGGRRSATDIRQNGLTPDELIQLTSANPAQTRAQVRAAARQADDIPAIVPGKNQVDDIPNPCRTLGLNTTGLCDVRDPFRRIERTEAAQIFDGLDDSHLIHYTDKSGIAEIAGSGRVRPGSKGYVYVTGEAFTQEEAHRRLFIAAETHKDKGSYVIIFKKQPGAAYRPTTDTVTPELVHEGTIRLRPDEVFYIGPNPFDAL